MVTNQKWIKVNSSGDESKIPSGNAVVATANASEQLYELKCSEQ